MHLLMKTNIVICETSYLILRARKYYPRPIEKIINNLIEKELICKRNSSTDGRKIELYVNNDNQMAELRSEVDFIQRSFNLLIDEVIDNKYCPNLDNLNLEHDIKVKIISLLSCILKLITFLIHEILVSFSSKIIIKNKHYLHEQYRHFQSKISEMLLSFDRLHKDLDDKSLDYIPFFTKRNDTSFKTFLWSVLICYETRLYPPYFIYTKKFKKTLFATMNLIYNLGKKYSFSFYDEIVCDASTYNNEFHGFPYARFARPLRSELKKLDYLNFIRLLIERCLLLKNFKYSSGNFLLTEIIESKNNKDLELDTYRPWIFKKIIANVNDYLYQIA